MYNCETKKLGDLVELNPDSIANNFDFDEIQYIDISSIGTGVQIEDSIKYSIEDAPSRAKRLVKSGDTILSTVRPNRRSFLYIKNPEKNLVVSTGFAVLRPKNEKIDSRFLYYVINDQYFTDYLTKNAKGAAYPAVDNDTVKRAEIPLPDLPTQQKIASILSAFDDLIENNTRRIEILEEMARRIYREWFVHFRYPGYENDGLVYSGTELGEIPDGWEVRELEDLCELTLGQSPKSEFYNERGEGLPFHQGVKDFGDRYPTTTTWCSKIKRVAEEGDILFSVRAPVGRINIANTRMVIGRGLHAIRSKFGNQVFIFHQLKDKFQEEDTMGGGTIFKSVTKKDMRNLKLLDPGQELIDDFEEKIGPIDLQIKVLTKRNIVLKETRDLLLPKLISGKVEV